MKKALIFGISGQDGAFLSRLLLSKGYEVWGTSRDSQTNDFNNLRLMGVKEQVRFISMAPNDFRSVLTALKLSSPDEVYHLAGQSSVGLSFDQPVDTLESITLSTLNILESIRFLDKPTKLYHASSSECFGDHGNQPATETTSFKPRSPYAVAKASAHFLVANYREAYGLYACNGILFNHESPLRQKRFVTQKIISSAFRIANGSPEVLTLGKLDIVRDWGWAEEYVFAMWLMMQQVSADDYVIATGQANSLKEFVNEAFSIFGLDWKNYVRSDKEFFRPTDLAWSQGCAAKAFQNLGWEAEFKMHDVVRMLMKSCKIDTDYNSIKETKKSSGST